MVAVAWGASWPEEKEGVKSREAVVAVGSEELWKRSPPRAVASTKAPSSTGWPVTLAEDGSSQFVYTPYENKTGSDSFTYVAIDPAGNSSPEAKVSLRIDKPDAFRVPWTTPAFRAAETAPLAQVGMASSSEKPVRVAPSRSSRPATDMAMVRNWARVTVWSGSKK